MRRLLILCLLIGFVNMQAAKAQDDYEKKGQFYIAPDFGLLIGSITRIELSPMFGYYLTNRLSLATGVRYEYYREGKIYYDPAKTSIYGPRAQFKFTVIENIANILPIGNYTAIFFQADTELLSLERKYFGFPSTNLEGRFWKSFALVGGGIRQGGGPNLFFNAVVLWDIDNSINSPYVNPIIKFGIQYNFVKRDSNY